MCSLALLKAKFLGLVDHTMPFLYPELIFRSSRMKKLKWLLLMRRILTTKLKVSHVEFKEYLHSVASTNLSIGLHAKRLAYVIN